MASRFNRFDRILVPPPTETKIKDDGLRYIDKPPGSIFAGSGTSLSGSLMSCFFCGTHRGSNSRLHQKVLGRSHAVCNPPCPQNKPALKALARMQEEAAAA